MPLDTDADTDIEVIVDPEPAAEPAPMVVETEAEPAESDDEPDELSNLHSQVTQLKQRNAELESREAASIETELQGHQSMLSAGLHAAKSTLEKAEKDLETAAAAGEWAKVAKAQSAIARATLDINGFEEALADVKHQAAQHKRQPQQQPANTDPFEARIATMADPSKAWCRSNRSDLEKPGRAAFAIAGAEMAVAAGVKPNTPEYFAYLNEHMGYGESTVKKTTTNARPVGAPRVAAPSGGKTAGRSRDQREIRLTPDQVKMAKLTGVPVDRYAKQHEEILKNAQDPSRGGPVYSNANARR